MDSPFLKSYPAKISINALSELTSRDRRTIKDRLKLLTPIETGPTGDLYDIRAALPMIFEFGAGDGQAVKFEGDDFQPAQEKSKLDFVKRQTMELELEERKRNLIPKEEIKTELENLFANVRAKLRVIPTRAAQRIQGPEQRQTEAMLSDLIDEALTELSEAKFDEAA